MKPEEVLKHYKTKYKFQQETGMAASSLFNWLEWGYIPEGSQYKIERITEGLFKAENIERRKHLRTPQDKLFREAKENIKDIINLLRESLNNLNINKDISLKALIDAQYKLTYMMEKIKNLDPMEIKNNE